MTLPLHCSSQHSTSQDYAVAKYCSTCTCASTGTTYVGVQVQVRGANCTTRELLDSCFLLTRRDTYCKYCTCTSMYSTGTSKMYRYTWTDKYSTYTLLLVQSVPVLVLYVCPVKYSVSLYPAQIKDNANDSSANDVVLTSGRSLDQAINYITHSDRTTEKDAIRFCWYNRSRHPSNVRVLPDSAAVPSGCDKNRCSTCLVYGK